MLIHINKYAIEYYNMLCRGIPMFYRVKEWKQPKCRGLSERCGLLYLNSYLLSRQPLYLIK